MNRIAASIPDPKIRFSKSRSKFDYRMLMNLDCDFSISGDSPVVKAYDYWNVRQNLLSNNEETHEAQESLYLYKRLKEEIIEMSGKDDIDYIVHTLVAYLYTMRKNSAKKVLWACFGDVILGNLRKNLKGKGKVCQVCGKRFMPKRVTQNYCSEECLNKARILKTVDARNNK